MVLRMVFLKNFNEDHEIDVADKYFWGWKNISKVKPFAITKNIRVYKKMTSKIKNLIYFKDIWPFFQKWLIINRV